MKKSLRLLICVIVISTICLPFTAYAWEGDCGYEGGISSGEAPGKTSYDYKEMCFVSGEPIVMSGTLTLKKSLKQDTIASTYTFNLSNIDKSATLTRTLDFNTKVTVKDNGQKVEETSLGKKVTEVIKIGSVTYTMKNYDFTRSSLVDPKPGINYYAGNTWGKKNFQVGAAANGSTITVEGTGNFYGYEQYWGNTEVQTINYVIKSEQKPTQSTGTTTSTTSTQSADKWGGTAAVSLSYSSTKKLRFVSNEPDQISFDGGYVQSQNNQAVLEYSSRLPEFDSKNVSTDNMLSSQDRLSTETFPSQTRLPVADIKQVRGHWAENDIKVLYALEVFKGNESIFDPDQFMSRAEFVKALVQAAKEVPTDPAFLSKTTAKTSSKNVKQTLLPFNDISKDNIYYLDVETAFKRGLIAGKGGSSFRPNDTLTVAEALTTFIRSLGLESLAPNPGAVTTFKDNDKIPEYARNSAFVAERIGLVQGDEKGNLKPNDELTKGRAAAFINRFINYMRDGIKKDYNERIVNY